MLWKDCKIIVDITFPLILGRTNYFQQIKENKLYLYQNYKVIIYFHALRGFETSIYTRFIYIWGWGGGGGLYFFVLEIIYMLIQSFY